MAPPSIPPALPPSVEEAYRRKCLQLKRRTIEVEEDNEAARVRLARLQRGVEKLRLERAFLLDQLAKRTSTNVEDSEGSPSPPPTPQDKPLRSKRGHRKPSVAADKEPSSNGPAATFINQSVNNLSPTSDTFSQSVTAGDAASSQQPKEGAAARSNGVGSGSKANKKNSTAFELYCSDHRAAVVESLAEGANVDEELARGWKELAESKRDEYKAKEKAASKESEKEKEKEKEAEADKADSPVDKKSTEKDSKEKESAKEKDAAKSGAPAESPAEDTPARDEDVEMEQDD